MGRPIRRDYKQDGKLKPYERCRKWELQVSITEKGKSRKRSKRYNDHTYREACEELARFRVQVENERPKSGWTFRMYAKSWIAKRDESSLSKSTLQNNRYAIDHANMAFGDKAIEDVCVDDVEAMKDELLSYFSKSAAHAHWSTVSSIFKSAVRSGVIASNPCELTNGPRKVRVKRDVPSLDKIMEIVSKMDPRKSGYELAMTLLASAGLRRGECCGLLWSDVRDGGLSITKQEGGKPTKTGESRFVPLPDAVYSMLEGMRGDDSEQVVSRSGGLTISGAALCTWWINNRKRYGADGVRIHDFRHAYVTALAESDAPIAIAKELVGHTTLEMTLNTYTHVHDGAMRDAVNETFGECFAANLRQD